MKSSNQPYRGNRTGKGRNKIFFFLLPILIVILSLLVAQKAGLINIPVLTALSLDQTPAYPVGTADKATPTGTSSSVSTAVPASATPEPTTELTPEPTPTPEPISPPAIIDPAKLALDWKPSPLFTSKTKTGTATWQSIFKGGGKLTWAVLQGGKAISNWKGSDLVAFGDASTYTEVEGVLAFRGNHARTSPAWGTRSVKDKKLEIVWTHEIGAISGEGSYWPGTGWTGQPLLVHWPEATRKVMNLLPEAKAKDLVEVVYPTLDGNIYFLDLESGKPTRNKIPVGFSFKGTGAIDPRGWPILYAGQGLNDNAGKKGAFKYRIYSLIDQKEIYSLPGSDPQAYRTWGAFDSSGLVNRQTDTLIECGENGLINRVKLNTVFNAEAGTLTMKPVVTKYRYRSSYGADLGTENSPAAYRNLLYFADNGGTLQCVDINTFEPVWMANLGDDTDVTTTVSEEPDGVFVYTANEVDKRLKAKGAGTAPCNLRKFNALTGELVWNVGIPCIYQNYINGGSLATPLIGKDDIADLIIFNVALTKNANSGKLIALDKKTGAKVWEREMDSYSWSSPVDIKSDDGKTYGIVCDFGGHMHLFDPRTGLDLDMISLEGNVESSPSVYNDMIVVGSYAKKIFGIKIR